MIISCLLILLSLLILFAGAECLVLGSSSIASRLGVSPLIIGLTIVAFGTSSPELVVSVKAALAGQGDIALGNVLGSNSFNIGVILGLTALICPIPVHLQIIRFDSPIALVVALILPLMMLDGVLTRIEGALLFVALLSYIFWNIHITRKQEKLTVADIDEIPSKSKRHWSIDLAMIVGGLILLLFGSNLLVDNSILVAKSLNVSDAVIGLTIVAAGTSMPELATSVLAALRKQPDIAIGNVVGSNIFNIVGILGIAGFVAPINSNSINPMDYLMVILYSVLLLPLIFTGRKLIRIEGVFLLSVYGIYLWLLWPKS